MYLLEKLGESSTALARKSLLLVSHNHLHALNCSLVVVVLCRRLSCTEHKISLLCNTAIDISLALLLRRGRGGERAPGTHCLRMRLIATKFDYVRMCTRCSFSSPSAPGNEAVMKCDTCAVDHVVRFTRHSDSVFANCNQSKTEARERG